MGFIQTARKISALRENIREKSDYWVFDVVAEREGGNIGDCFVATDRYYGARKGEDSENFSFTEVEWWSSERTRQIMKVRREDHVFVGL